MSDSPVGVRSTCRGCGSFSIVKCVPLASVPIVSPNVAAEGAAAAATKITAPLDTYLCRDCGLIQLIHVVDPELLYRHYLYRTSISLALPEHFRVLAATVAARLKLGADDLVVEFGSNDGTLLAAFQELGTRVLGVEPAAMIAARAEAREVPTLVEFFGERLAGRIATEYGKAAVVVANNVLANIDDLDEIGRGLTALLTDDGVFVCETQYALDMFERFLLDVIYHEHLSTFSVRSVKALFARFAMELFDAERIATKGGSIRFWVQRLGGKRRVTERVQELIDLEYRTGLYDLAYLKRFGDRVHSTRRDILEIVDTVRDQGGTVAGYGTSVGCAALIHQFELQSRLSYCLDDTPFKHELKGPGYQLPVYAGEQASIHHPELIVVLAWRYADVIISKQQDYINQGGRFVIPLPEARLVPERAGGDASGQGG